MWWSSQMHENSYHKNKYSCRTAADCRIKHSQHLKPNLHITYLNSVLALLHHFVWAVSTPSNFSPHESQKAAAIHTNAHIHRQGKVFQLIIWNKTLQFLIIFFLIPLSDSFSFSFSFSYFFFLDSALSSPVNIKVPPLIKQNKSMLCLCVCSYSKSKSVMGQHKSLFSTQKKIAQDKKKRPLRFNYTSPLLLTRKKCTLAMSSSITKIPVPVAFFLPIPVSSFCPCCQEFLSWAQVCNLSDGAWKKKSSDSPYLCMSVGMLVPDVWFLFYFLQGLASLTEVFFSDAWVRLSINCFFQWVTNSFSPLVCLVVS